MLTRTPTHRVTISLHLICKGISSEPCHGWYFNTSPWGFHEVTSEIHNSFEIFLWRSFWTSTQNSSPYPTFHMISHPLGSFHFSMCGGGKTIKPTLSTVVSLDENIESWMSQICTPHELLQSSIFFMLARLEVKSSLSATSPLFRISETSMSPQSIWLHLLPLFCREDPASFTGWCNGWQHRSRLSINYVRPIT